MPFNVPMALRQRRLVRAGAAVLVLVAAAFAQYKVTNLARPVSLEATGKFAPAVVKLDQEELIIEGPVVSAEEGLLLSDEGRPNETVDVSFDRGRLADKTLKDFESVGLSPPSTPARIDYQAQEPARPPIGDESCRTRVELRLASKPPAAVRLFQLGPPGRERYRQLELTTDGADLFAGMATVSPGDSARAPGCQKVLKVGNDWSRSLTDLEIETVVTADSTLHFRFYPLSDAASWDGAEGFFEPFDFGSEPSADGPPAFQAHAVRIRPRRGSVPGASASARLTAESTGDGRLLTVYGLKVGSDQLQISVSGKGWVQADGVNETVNLFGSVRDNTLSYLLLGTANLALLGWATRLIFKKPHISQSDDQPSA